MKLKSKVIDIVAGLICILVGFLWEDKEDFSLDAFLIGVGTSILASGIMKSPLSESDHGTVGITVDKKLDVSAFSREERKQFYKKKWLRDNTASLMVDLTLVIGAMVAGIVREVSVCTVVAAIIGIIWSAVKHNQMMTYVEKKVFE